MIKEKRLEEMARYILDMRTVSMKELSDKFAISQNTLRRDLNELLEDHRFKKVYGGVTVIEENSLVDYSERHQRTISEKKQIGQKAASLIEQNDLIFIDSGTTTSEMAPYLPKEFNFTLMTNSLQIIEAAAHLNNIKLIVVGSHFSPRTQSFTGTEANSLFEHYNINKAFMSSTAVSISNGVTNSDLNEFKIKSVVMKKAQTNSLQRNFLLVDHTKFGKTALLTYAELTQFDAIVTSNAIPSKYSSYLQENNVQLATTEI